MEPDHEVAIERVNNGFIVRPFSFPELGRGIMHQNTDIFVFETFDAMVEWLDTHFTKPEQKSE